MKDFDKIACNRTFVILLLVIWATIAGLSVSPALSGTWDIQTVDTGNQYASLALDSSDKPHISYYGGMINPGLRYAAWNGSTWNTETVAGGGLGDMTGQYTSLALDSSSKPRISYLGDIMNPGLKYAAWNGSTWDIETVDGGITSGPEGQNTSLALDSSSGKPRISYHDSMNMALKYAAWNGSIWVIETVDGGMPGDMTGQYASLALDSSGRPRISYHDSVNMALKYAAWNGSIWVIETVDTGMMLGQYTSLALDSSDKPRISYYGDMTTPGLKYAAWNGSTWNTETVDGGMLGGSAGQYTSLALDSSGKARISYYDGDLINPGLKFAAWNGFTWDIETVDSEMMGGPGGQFTSLALDSSDKPHISYPVGFMNPRLRYASPFLGDANNDGVVSADDYGSVQLNFGDTGVPGILGDANYDGVVSADDYGSVQLNFGDTAGLGSVPVPEPASAGLLLLGFSGLLWRRMKR